MSEPQKLSAQQFDRFRDFIYRQSGIRVEVSKIALVSNRIRRRLRAGEHADFDAYYSYLTSPRGADELEEFLDAITTNETHFFRTPRHFDWFKGDFVTDLVSRHRSGERQARLRVWSAACSTGEEPYSLSICLAENALRLRGWETAIVGTDISEAALKEARSAVYRVRSLEHVDAVQLRRYFEAQADGASWQVRPSVRGLVEFYRHNLMQPLRLPPFDCIFIRNVLIYFDRESKKVVIRNLIQALARGGHLVVGPSEGIYDMLEPLVKRDTFLYQKA
ncbi:MAG: CheR family methyltransferase [Planctomycetaceae bacterium]